MEEIIMLKLSQDDLKLLISKTIKQSLQEELQAFNPSNNQKDADLLSIKCAAAYLRISIPTLRKFIKQGLIRPKRLGTLIRFDKNELDECLNNGSLKHGRVGYVR